MARITHRFESPDRFVAGTVGEPGQRTFFLQAREGNRLVSVVCEKQQVEVLADHLERILDELTKLADDPTVIPSTRSVARDLEPLDAPLEEDFRAGTMTLAWDPVRAKVQLELFSVTEDPEMDLPGPMGLADGVDMPDDAAELMGEFDEVVSAAAESLSVSLSPEQGREFTARARALVQAGRPACPFCSQPINPDGHICPRANGYRRPLFL